MEETNDERIDRMRKRAQELREKRETERKKVVDEKMRQKWRNDCDELRQVESKVFEREVAAARAEQSVAKQMAKVKLEEERKYYDHLWEQERLKKLQREEQDRLVQHKRNEEMIAMLNEQMNMRRQKAEEDLHLKKEEALYMVLHQSLLFSLLFLSAKK